MIYLRAAVRQFTKVFSARDLKRWSKNKRRSFKIQKFLSTKEKDSSTNDKIVKHKRKMLKQKINDKSKRHIGYKR